MYYKCSRNVSCISEYDHCRSYNYFSIELLHPNLYSYCTTLWVITLSGRFSENIKIIFIL